MTQVNALAITGMDATRMAVIVHRTQANTPMEYIMAGAKMQMISDLKKRLRNEVVKFVFRKKNGEYRTMYATTMRALVEEHTSGTGESREKYATTAVFDVEAGAWRSFRWESIVRVF